MKRFGLLFFAALLACADAPQTFDSSVVDAGTFDSTEGTGTEGRADGGHRLGGIVVAPVLAGSIIPGSNGQCIVTTGGLSAWGACGGGSGPSVTGTGVAHVTSGTFDSSAYIGTAGQALLTNAGATDTAWTTFSGDVTVSTSTVGKVTVASVNGTTVPAGGSLTTGNGLYASGSSAATWRNLNLAGGSGWVTGVLPLGNMASPTGTGLAHVTAGTFDSTANKGTSGQSLFTNSGATDTVWGSFSGDFTCSTATPGLCTISQLGGSAPVSVVNGALSFGSTVASVGGLRFPNATTIVAARNAANSADLTVLSTDSSNDVKLDAVAALDLGTSSATSIALGTSGITTTITGGLTQLTGAYSLTGNGASSLTTSSGALTLTSGASATWSTSSGALAVSGASTLGLTAAAGNVTVNGAGASNGVLLQAAGTTVAQLQAASTDFLAFGTGTVSTVGFLRFPNSANTVLAQRTSASANTTLISTDSSNNLQVNGSAHLFLQAGGATQIQVDTTDVYLSVPAIEFANTLTSPNIGQLVRTSDAAAQSFTVSGQSCLATASTNTTGGSVNITAGAGATSNATFTSGSVNLGVNAPNSGGPEAYVNMQRAGSTQAAIGQLSSSFAALWLGPGISPSTSNYALTSSGSGVTAINAATTLDFNIGASTKVVISSTSLTSSIPVEGSGAAPFQWRASSIALTNANVTLSAAQQSTPVIRLTGTLTGSVQLIFPNSAGYWVVDCRQLTLSGQTLTLASGTDTHAISTLSASAITVITDGSNHIASSL